jgi:hypothetical protein
VIAPSDRLADVWHLVHPAPWVESLGVDRRQGRQTGAAIGDDQLEAAALVYPHGAHQLCLAHWFRLLEDLTSPLDQARRREFRRQFWWI